MNVRHLYDLVSPVSYFKISKDYFGPGFRRFIYLFDYYVCLFFYGCTVTDYCVYEFWCRRHRSRREYVTLWKLHRACNVLNKKEFRKFFSSKLEFNKKFMNYRSIEWLDCSDKSISEAIFERWCSCKSKIIVKKAHGGGEGKTLKMLYLKDLDVHDLYNKLFPSDNIIEDLYIQNGILHELNPSSVNTVRIFTVLQNSGTVIIPYAVLRIGCSDDFRDNAAGGNIFALIDPESGVVISKAVNKKLQQFAFHPVSGKQIVGVTIPRWNEVLQLVKNAANVCPEVRHVGWDVAISDNDISLIEGNDDGDPVMQEMILGHGIWPEYREYMRS